MSISRRWRTSTDRLRIIAANEVKPVGEIAPYDEFQDHHQVPGGLISNRKSELEPLGIAHRLEAILDEAGRMRADLGYPIVVSPFAQFIITQSVQEQKINKLCATPPSMTRCAGTCSATTGRSRDRSIRTSTTALPVAPSRLPSGRCLLAPPALDRLRAARGPFTSDDDLLLAAYYDEREYGALKAAGPIATEYPIAEPPLLSLVKALTRRPGLSSVRLTRRD